MQAQELLLSNFSVLHPSWLLTEIPAGIVRSSQSYYRRLKEGTAERFHLLEFARYSQSTQKG